MENSEQKWMAEEEEALRAGVRKHGAGKWMNILKDPEFNHILYSRSNIDLRVKWRAMEKSRTPNPNVNTDTSKYNVMIYEALSALKDPNGSDARGIVRFIEKWTADEEEALRAGVRKHGAGKWKSIQRDPEFNHILYSRSNIDLKDKWRAMEKSRTPNPNVNTDTSKYALVHTVHMEASQGVLRYNVMIYEALSALKDPNGSDARAIVRFIEKSHEVLPQYFRRIMSFRLRELVADGKLEMVQKRYRFGRGVVYIPKPKEIRPRPSQINSYIGGILEEEAVADAYIVAEAENKAFVAAEVAKEAERVAELQLDKETHEPSNFNMSP